MPDTETPRRRGPYAKSADRRRTIVDAAMRVFAARGYLAASMREVALEAGTTLSTLQHHFAIKEDLLVAVLQRRDEADPITPDPHDHHGFLRHVAERARANESVRGLIELYSVLLGEATTAGHPGQSYFTDRFDLLRREYAAHFTRLRDEGRLRAGVDPVIAATSLIALWDGLQLQWLLDSRQIDVAPHLQAFLDLVVEKDVRETAG